MPNIKTIFAISCVLSTALLLSACNKDQPPAPNNEKQGSSVNNSIGELNPTPIKQFPATPDDGHDIAILEDYDQRFTAMSDSMEIELAKMKEANTLTPEFEQQRQKDNIRSALTMLKELELKPSKAVIFRVCCRITGRIRPKLWNKALYRVQVQPTQANRWIS